MQQTCSQCGAAATVPSKFCRNCGSPLPADSPATEAATRQYGRQAPAADAPPTSSPFTSPTPHTPSVSDAFAADTARLHQQQQTAPPPYAQPYGQPLPAAYPPAYPVQTPPKSNWWKWLLGFVLVSLLVCGGLLGYAFKRASDAVPQVQHEVEKAIQKAQEEAERAARESGAPPGVPGPPGVPAPPPPPAKALPQSLEELRYPKSQEINKTEVFGQQVLTLMTADSVADVKAYYEKLLGQAPIQSKDGSSESVVFMRKPYMVTVANDRKSEGRTTIALIRSGFIPDAKAR